MIDGKATRFDDMALRGFQAANGLHETGKLDTATQAVLSRARIKPVRTVQIPDAFAKGPFVADLPNSTAKQASYDHLGYRNLMEALAERFHTTPETIVALNTPQTRIGSGTVVRVPNVADFDTARLGEDERRWNATLVTLGVAPVQPRAHSGTGLPPEVAEEWPDLPVLLKPAAAENVVHRLLVEFHKLA